MVNSPLSVLCQWSASHGLSPFRIWVPDYPSCYKFVSNPAMTIPLFGNKRQNSLKFIKTNNALDMATFLLNKIIIFHLLGKAWEQGSISLPSRKFLEIEVKYNDEILQKGVNRFSLHVNNFFHETMKESFQRKKSVFSFRQTRLSIESRVFVN